MKAAFTFGRFNPPTTGHEKLLDFSYDYAKKYNADFYIYLSHKFSKKDPLRYKNKLYWMRKIFPQYKSDIEDSTSRTPLDVLVDLYENGYKSVCMVVGSDRQKDFDKLLNKYNGKASSHGYYSFERIIVTSAGARDPDSDGVEGMSASKLRQAVVDDDIELFFSGIPDTLSDYEKAELFSDIGTGLGVL